MAWRAGVFELAFEQNISGLLGQRGENLAGAGDELVKLECQKCTCPQAASFCFREADTGQKSLKTASASFDLYAAVL